ncbi:prokaryotic molybdopterin-containing oxidoreductase family, membrane subunit [Desulfacinum hydrothermale DSM 13146]|uniref:Prokaryotic molybdopterin-containing oxidoreductase family, membrane subunit n=1 Tax=Desulfacinum hydrothermale DSM 13146 TaxID=1121390 RepID=A0A1W1XGP1_9BACT|nr:menaquinone reductase integral membrane subunit QrcD [Desulfacinum hydrothermale]SMC23129.1 prokaryotic molybdopterin-containing oxidoreductase family, membrane subunit [Desulfacinum hydrothermale DSM 13146]
MDKALIPEGVKRCPLPVFGLWMLVLFAVIAWGIYAGLTVLLKGLNVTGLNNYFGFGLYICVDLGIIALGAGAFFSGFLYYGLSRFFPQLKELHKIINLAVIVGFCCYTGALLVLLLEIGQPLRGWFGYWHANVHSMLTEVIFCISCYAIVLVIEFVPIILENRKLDAIKPVHIFGHNLHEIMAIFAMTGTFLSFFHQGSLGGVPGVMFGRPFAYREGFFVWPWTFFLFTLSAMACGPAFTAIICRIIEKVSRKQLVDRSVYELIGKIEGGLLLTYLILKGLDTLYWALDTAPGFGLKLSDFYQEPYGMWLLVAELGICGVIPVILLLTPQARKSNGLLFLAFFLDCTGIVINRFAMTVEALAIPVMPFDHWAVYIPTVYEWAPCIAMLAYGALIVSLSYRYLPVFPREPELNP